MAEKVVRLGVYGVGRSVKSTFDISVENGAVYLAIEDRESGVNTRSAKIALSPDRMRLVGSALKQLSVEPTMDDLDLDGWSRIGKVRGGNV